MAREPGGETFRDTALFAAMLLILSGVGLAPLGGLSRGTGTGRGDSELVAVGPGQRMEREHLLRPIEPPPRVADPQRVRSLLPVGGIREVLVKGGYIGTLAAAAGSASDCSLAYAFQTLTTRTIESNDGRRIVERVHFQKRDLIKAVAPLGQLRLEIGRADEPWPDFFHNPIQGRSDVEVPVERAASVVVIGGLAESAASRAVVSADSLRGKTVRIMYVDGEGVASIEPIGCRLTHAEAAFLFHTAVLADLCIVPAEASDLGEKWSTDAGQLVGLLDPALRAVPSGCVSLRRSVEPSPLGYGNEATTIRLDGDRGNFVSLTPPLAPDRDSRERHRFLAYYLLEEGGFRVGPGGLLESARLQGSLKMVSVWQDYFLFDEIVEGCPELVISYSCKVR